MKGSCRLCVAAVPRSIEPASRQQMASVKVAPRQNLVMMRVLVVHSYYTSTQPSGESRVVDQQVAALQDAGFEVFLHARRTDDYLHSFLYPAKAAATVATGMGDGGVLRAIEGLAPDVVHVHNLFPNFGRRWAARAGAPLVATLHNFRPICPAGTLFRDGRVCTDCLDSRSARPAVQHSCYRDHRVHTLPLAISTKFDQDPVLIGAERLVVLSERMRGLYSRAGVPAEKMTVVPNFLPDGEDCGPGDGGDYWLFVGRLSHEKGVDDLVRRWPAGRRLVVAGSGPLANELAKMGRAGVELVGSVPSARVQELMAGARGLLFSSKWFEGFPLVYLEALAAGTPVLSWEPSTVASMVSADGTGLVGGPDLESDLDQADRAFGDLRAHCRQIFEARYTQDAYVASIRSIYEAASGSA